MWVYNLEIVVLFLSMNLLNYVKGNGKNANYEEIENQLGDVPHTYADINKARDLYYLPKVKLEKD